MKPKLDSSRMTREIYDIPDELVVILETTGLWSAYQTRPAYQQNDDIGWIYRAKRQETRDRRIAIMLAELAAGHGYMKLPWGKKS